MRTPRFGSTVLIVRTGTPGRGLVNRLRSLVGRVRVALSPTALVAFDPFTGDKLRAIPVCQCQVSSPNPRLKTNP
jgi:hypothetical protein